MERTARRACGCRGAGVALRRRGAGVAARRPLILCQFRFEVSARFVGASLRLSRPRSTKPEVEDGRPGVRLSRGTQGRVGAGPPRPRASRSGGLCFFLDLVNGF
jgi:hypothetical protein